MGIFLVGGAWEYARLYRAVQLEPSEIITVGGVLVIATARFFFADLAIFAMVVCVLLAMTVHIIAYERGRDKAALDFSVTVTGIVYLGWLMFILPLVWAADTGGYSIGAVYGRHKMSPRLSPKKSWEGYVAGIFTAIYVGALFAYAFSALGPQPLKGLITPLQGALIGFLISAIAPLGDLGESMFKRQGGMKDSSNIFPGHGGFLDRIDSWIWGSAIGYFILLFFIL
jgi:phosphatidate cytidylyltransferase